MKTNKMTIEKFHKLLDDPKTVPIILFEQMMDYWCESDYEKYLKILEEIGAWVDEARIGHGFKMKYTYK